MGNSRFVESQFNDQIARKMQMLEGLRKENAQYETQGAAAPQPKSKNASVGDVAHDVYHGTVTGVNRFVSSALKIIPELITGEQQKDDILGIGSAAEAYAKQNPSKSELVLPFKPKKGEQAYKGEGQKPITIGTQEIVAPVVNFLTSFVPVSGATTKVLQGVGWLNKLGKGGKAIATAANAIDKVKNGSKVVQVAGKAAKATADGAIAAGVGLDQYEDRLSNLINSKTGGPISEFLMADPDDHPTVARVKNAMEDALFGIFAEAGMAVGSAATKHLVKQTIKGVEYMKVRAGLKKENPSVVAAMDAELAKINADIDSAMDTGNARAAEATDIARQNSPMMRDLMPPAVNTKTSDDAFSNLVKGADTTPASPNMPDPKEALEAFRTGGAGAKVAGANHFSVPGNPLAHTDIFDRMMASVADTVDAEDAARMREEFLASFKGGSGGSAVPEEDLAAKLASTTDEASQEAKVPYSGSGVELDLPTPAVSDELNLPGRASVVDELNQMPNKHLIDNSAIREKVLNRGAEGIIEYLDDIKKRVAPEVDPYDLGLDTEGGLLQNLRNILSNDRGAAVVANGSGESSASIEAIRRAASEAKEGLVRYILDVRTGKATPLRGVDSVDTMAQAGKVIVQEGIGKGGKKTVLSMGKGVNQGLLSRWGLGNQRGSAALGNAASPLVHDAEEAVKALPASAIPTKTVKAYKLFRTDPNKPGELFPLFVGANDSVKMGQWVDAQIGEMVGGKVKSKIGPLAMRPGWHSGDLPIATHIGGKTNRDLIKPDYRPDNQVWAEVEVPADVDWQGEALKRARITKAGKVDPKTAHITDQVPVGGHYRYKTNTNMTGEWLISGAMKVNRILDDSEVHAINSAAGVSDLPRLPKGTQFDEAGFTVSAMLPTMAGGSGGFFIDYNQDGEHDWEDIALGVLLGGTTTAAINVGRKIFHGSDDEAMAALAKVKAEKLAHLDATEAKIKTAMTNVHVDQAKKEAWVKDLESLANIRKTIEAIEKPKTLISKVKDANAVAQFKPVVTIKEGTAKAIIKDMRDGNFPKMMEGIDFNFENLVHPDDAEDAIKQLTNLISIHADDETQKAMRGVVGWDSTEAMASKIADDYGMSLANVNQLFKRTKGMEARFLAAEHLSVSTKVRMKNMIDSLGTDPSLEQLNELDKMVSFAAAIQAQVKGSQAEIARAMNAMKIAAKVRKNLSLEGLTSEQMQGIRNQLAGTVDRSAKLKALNNLKQLMEAGDQKRVNRYLRGYTGNPTLKFINELHRTVMLTAPATHIANATGSVITTAMRFLETGAADLIGGKFTMPQMRAMAEGLASKETFEEALQMAVQAFKTGESALSSSTKLDDPVHGISYDVFKQSYIGQAVDWIVTKLGVDGILQKSIDGAGTVMRGTFNTLNATDEFFKVMNYRMSLHKLAYNQAFEEAAQKGLVGEAFEAAVKSRKVEIIESPTEELFDKAVKEAEVATFNNTPEGIMGSFAKTIGKHQELQLAVPFSKTPANLMNYVFDRIPLNYASKKVRDTFKTGTQAQKQEMYARWTVGTFLLGGAWMASAGGLITGGADRDMSGERTSGWQPYSLKLGDKYYSFDRFDPLSSFLGIGADLYQIIMNSDDETTVGKAVEAGLISISRNITSKTMLQGLVEALDLLRAGDRTAATYLKKFATSFVPAISTAAEKQLDPTLSSTIDLYDEFKAKIPGLSKTLPPRLDILGDPIKAVTLGPEALSPIKMSTESKDPVRQEIARLNIDTAQRLRGMKTIVGVDLTPEQYHKYVKINGEILKEDLTNIIDDPAYQDAPDDPYSPNSKKSIIKKAMERSVSQAAARLLEEDEKLSTLLDMNAERRQEGQKPLQQDEMQ